MKTKRVLRTLPLAAAALCCGCVNLSRVETPRLDEAGVPAGADLGGPWRVVDFSSKMQGSGGAAVAGGSELHNDGELLTERLAELYPGSFSASEKAKPLVVRQTVAVEPLETSVVKSLGFPLTLGFLPTGAENRWSLGVSFLRPDDEWTPPFDWQLRMPQIYVNRIAAATIYTEGKGWKRGWLIDGLAKQQEQDRSLTKKQVLGTATEDETRKLFEDSFWNSVCAGVGAEEMRTRAAKAIAAALAGLSPAERKALADNPAAAARNPATIRPSFGLPPVRKPLAARDGKALVGRWLAETTSETVRDGKREITKLKRIWTFREDGTMTVLTKSSALEDEVETEGTWSSAGSSVKMSHRNDFMDKTFEEEQDVLWYGDNEIELRPRSTGGATVDERGVMTVTMKTPWMTIFSSPNVLKRLKKSSNAKKAE